MTSFHYVPRRGNGSSTLTPAQSSSTWDRPGCVALFACPHVEPRVLLARSTRMDERRVRGLLRDAFSRIPILPPLNVTATRHRCFFRAFSSSADICTLLAFCSIYWRIAFRVPPGERVRQQACPSRQGLRHHGLHRGARHQVGIDSRPQGRRAHGGHGPLPRGRPIQLVQVGCVIDFHDRHLFLEFVFFVNFLLLRVSARPCSSRVLATPKTVACTACGVGRKSRDYQKWV